MEHKDAAQAFKHIFTAFPSYAHWIEQQNDPSGTMGAWCRMLKACEAQDVFVVVDCILDGSINPRDKYDKIDSLPLVIRQRAMRIKGDRERFQATDKLTSTPRNNEQHVHALPKLFAEVRRNNKLVKEGKMTPEERDELLLDIRRRARLTR